MADPTDALTPMERVKQIINQMIHAGYSGLPENGKLADELDVALFAFAYDEQSVLAASRPTGATPIRAWIQRNKRTERESMFLGPLDPREAHDPGDSFEFIPLVAASERPTGATAPVCSICAGSREVHGEPCICTTEKAWGGTEQGEMHGLRHQLFRAQNDVARLQGKPLPFPDVFGSDVAERPTGATPWYPDDIDVSQVQMRAVMYADGRGLSRDAVAAVLLALVDYGRFYTADCTSVRPTGAPREDAPTQVERCPHCTRVVLDRAATPSAGREET